MELDCHGKTWAEALAEFIARYNGALQAGSGDTLDIIHGYGSTGAGGTIRARLRAFLDRYPNRLEWQPGESVDGNQGHTLVRPGRPPRRCYSNPVSGAYPGAARAAAARSRRPAGGTGLGVLRPAAGGEQNHGEVPAARR